VRLKRRTREHVIADLSVNHVERFILRCGYSILRNHTSDYGIDLLKYTYGPSGDVEPGEVKFQIKATDRLQVLKDHSISVTVATADLFVWAREEVPVVLVVYDAANDCGYWLDVREWARSRMSTPEDWRAKTVQVRIPIVNRLSTRVIRRIRLKKQDLEAEKRMAAPKRGDP
jgi:hypothetical protein